MAILLRTTALLFLLVSLLPLSGFAQNDAVVYGALGDRSAPAAWTFRIAFWRDPDLAALVSRQREDSLDDKLWRDPDFAALVSRQHEDSLNEKLSRFGERLKTEMGKELQAVGFGDFTITLIEDYDRLEDERLKGDGFYLLHCDPAMYLLGKAFLETNREEDPYAPLVEEVSPEEAGMYGAAIWVRKDSNIHEVRDLVRRHIAIPHHSSLMGGALQRAALLQGPEPHIREGLTEGTGDYELTTCGSTSDTLFRLATGLATEKPIEAAFLPLQGPGFRLVLRELGLKTIADLPFRVLSSIPTDSLPGFPLLVNTYFLRKHPQLCQHLKEMLLRERFPYRWGEVDVKSMKQLAQDLAPLSSFESIAP